MEQKLMIALVVLALLSLSGCSTLNRFGSAPQSDASQSDNGIYGAYPAGSSNINSD